jgi:hypothetical protein
LGRFVSSNSSLSSAIHVHRQNQKQQFKPKTAKKLMLVLKPITMRHSQLLLFLLIASLTISCDPLTDCIIRNRPELPEKIFPSAYLGSYYEESLRAAIDNSPNDDGYFYYFFISNLPRGLDYESEGRELFIYGVPEETGNFEFNIVVSVDEPHYGYGDDNDGIFDDDDNLCDDSTSRIYRLRIQ